MIFYSKNAKKQPQTRSSSKRDFINLPKFREQTEPPRLRIRSSQTSPISSSYFVFGRRCFRAVRHLTRNCTPGLEQREKKFTVIFRKNVSDRRAPFNPGVPFVYFFVLVETENGDFVSGEHRDEKKSYLNIFFYQIYHNLLSPCSFQFKRTAIFHSPKYT